MTATSTDRIERHIDMNAPITRVWRALTDHTKFSAWFGGTLNGPFQVGRSVRADFGECCGHKDARANITVVAMDPEHYFAWHWHPFAIDPAQDYSAEEPTLVEFRLQPIDGGTRLSVVESGFDRIPAHRRDEAFRMNSGGWDAQIRNIAEYVNRQT